MRKKLRYEQNGETKERFYTIGHPAPGLDHLYFQNAYLQKTYGYRLSHADTIWLNDQKKLAEAKGVSLEDFLIALEKEDYQRNDQFA